MQLDALIRLSDETEAALGRTIESVSHFIFTHPELGMEEYESSAYLAALMQENGFTVQKPYAGMETAFYAEYGDPDGPVIAFLAEYDALPGYGPQKKPAHACGHNFIAASTVGAALVLKALKPHFHGRIVLFGTPAEETYGGKADMARQGCFDRVDAAFQAHPARETTVSGASLAMRTYEFRFKGKAAHASASPHEGVNALDAVMLMFAGVNALRQHVLPTTRIHGIVTDGGAAPNIVPDDAACLYFIRAPKKTYRDEVVRRVIDCARGAALMTGAELQAKETELALDDCVELPCLTGLMQKELTRAGLPVCAQTGAEPSSGSTDVGNVSYACPTQYADVALRPDMTCDCHEEAFLNEADSPEAMDALHRAVRALCGAALTLYQDPALLRQAREEFNTRVKGA